MRQPIIAANWKLHKTTAEARQFMLRWYNSALILALLTW